MSVGRLQQSLATEQLRLAVSEAKEPKIKASHELVLRALPASKYYQGAFSIDIENTSKTRVEVSWVVFELYVGKVTTAIPDHTVVSINEPPKRELNIEEAGIVDWQHHGSRGFLYPSSKRLNYSAFAGEKYYRIGGGLTKSLAPGDRSAYSMPIYVNATPDSWVAIVAILGLDGAQERDGVLFYSDWVDLASARTAP